MNQELWEECVRFHGHACPGLAIGYRAAEAASERLGTTLRRTEDEDIVCVSENDSCGVDSIQCTMSCTVGKGNMILRPRGKNAFSFFDRDTGRSVRAVLKPFDRSGEKRDVIDRVLNMPLEELFDFKEPGFPFPERARMFESRTCEICGESAREDMMRFQNGKIVCLDCFKGYDRGWM